MAMRFVVKLVGGPRPPINRYPVAVLNQDSWDDYGYKSTFEVVLYLSEADRVDLGTIKILETGSTGGYTKMPPKSFRTLPATHASLGANMEYYEKLYKLGPSVFRPYLEGLRDIVFSDEAKAAIEDTEGFRVSMLRFGGAERTISDAVRLLRSSL
jgi:hypothetical protein